MKNLLSNPLGKFILKVIGLLVVWYAIYQFVLHPHTRIDRVIIDNIIYISSFILEALGYDLIPKPDISDSVRTIGIDGTHGLWIGDSCNGLTILAVFTILIVSFPGNWKKKLWFIPLGLLIIHFTNIIRICILSIIVTIDYNLLQINHDYIFLVIVWSIIFLLWYWWINKYSELKMKDKE